MKFSVNQSELQNALAVVVKGSSTRSTLSILAGVYIKAEEGRITLQTTNLELSIKVTCFAMVEEPGETVVPAKLFGDIIKNLPDMAVRVEADENTATVFCDSTTFSLKALNPLDFPAFPEIEADQEASFPFNAFSSMVKRTAKVVSHDETRIVLTGVLVSCVGSTLKMVATDSYRLAVSSIRHALKSSKRLLPVLSFRTLLRFLSRKILLRLRLTTTRSWLPTVTPLLSTVVSREPSRITNSLLPRVIPPAQRFQLMRLLMRFVVFLCSAIRFPLYRFASMPNPAW